MTILGYKYNTETEAQIARKQCADYYGLPVSQDSVTIYYIDYDYSLEDNFYYIIWAQGVTEVLGEPTEFELTITT
jgi:hypothetical protein